MMKFKLDQQQQMKDLVSKQSVLQDKVSVLLKVRKDFPQSDDVRFELQDTLTQLGECKKDIMCLETKMKY